VGTPRTPRDEWEQAFEASRLRDVDYATMSGIPVEPVYGPADGEFPGVYPYTRGPYASMYRSKLWTMRMFAGFGTALDTNRRFHELLAAGSEPLFSKPEAERSPLEAQLVRLAGRQIIEEGGKVDFPKKLKGDEKTKWEGLKKQLAEQEKTKPQQLPEAMMVSDVGPVASPVVIPGKRKPEEIAPGVLSVLNPAPLEILQPSTSLNSTGRRTALAQWLTRPDNPLTPRVMVNRLWQYHFGKGLVESSSDFGRLGEEVEPRRVEPATERQVGDEAAPVVERVEIVEADDEQDLAGVAGDEIHPRAHR
jgi:hypothetical protein